MSEPSVKPRPARRLLSSGIPGVDYGVFLLAAPVIGGIGALITAFASYSLAGCIWVAALTALVTAIMAVLEIVQAPAAWDPEPPVKPIAKWSALITFAWPVGYPLYLKERSR